MKEIIKRENDRLIIDNYDVTDCPTIKYSDSYNPMCGDSSVTCHGNPNCLFKKCIDKDREHEKTKDKCNKLEDEISSAKTRCDYYKDMCIDLLLREVRHLREENEELQRTRK